MLPLWVFLAEENRHAEEMPVVQIEELANRTKKSAGSEAWIMRPFMSAGREFMGDWFNRKLDYPARLVNTMGQDEQGTENPFWICRECNGMEHERMAGIYWCAPCAREKREERSAVFYASHAEQARQAAARAAQAAVRAAKRPIDEPYKGSLRMREPYK